MLSLTPVSSGLPSLPPLPAGPQLPEGEPGRPHTVLLWRTWGGSRRAINLEGGVEW